MLLACNRRHESSFLVSFAVEECLNLILGVCVIRAGAASVGCQTRSSCALWRDLRKFQIWVSTCPSHFFPLLVSYTLTEWYSFIWQSSLLFRLLNSKNVVGLGPRWTSLWAWRKLRRTRSRKVFSLLKSLLSLSTLLTVWAKTSAWTVSVSVASTQRTRISSRWANFSLKNECGIPNLSVENHCLTFTVWWNAVLAKYGHVRRSFKRHSTCTSDHVGRWTFCRYLRGGE